MNATMPIVSIHNVRFFPGSVFVKLEILSSILECDKMIENYPVYRFIIKKRIEELGYSKNEVCRRMGITYNVLQRNYNSDIIRIDLQIVSKFCAVLDCKVEDIINLS